MTYGLCLQDEGNFQFREDLLLNGCRTCEHDGGRSIAEAHGIAGQGCKVLQQGAEAVNRAAIGRFARGGLGFGCGGDLGGRHGRRPLDRGIFLIVILEEQRRQRLAHMPDQVISEHAQEHMGAHALGEAVVDGADFEVHGFHRAKGALDVSEAFIGRDDGGSIEPVSGDTCPQHIEAIEGRLLLDQSLVSREGEGCIGDRQLEVLGHLALAKAPAFKPILSAPRKG